MDKFGIFKLLNALLAVKNEENGNEKAASAPLVNENSQDQTVTPKEKAPQTALKSQLYSTINSHEEFIKRVYKNNTPAK